MQEYNMSSNDILHHCMKQFDLIIIFRLDMVLVCQRTANESQVKSHKAIKKYNTV